MRVYLAAPYAARDVIRTYADALRAHDIDPTASWIDEEHDINAGTTGAATSLDDLTVSRHAETDLFDIDHADAVVLFTPGFLDVDATSSGGRHVETGYALATHTPLIVVGEPENVFHRLLDGRVTLVRDWHGALGALTDLAEELAEVPC